MEKGIEIFIDKLTNSIENRITGDVFDTEVFKIQQEDLKRLETGWNFDWLHELNLNPNIFKLVIKNNPNIIQGLVSLEYPQGFVAVRLIENASFNMGSGKVYEGVAGNMFAFACKESWDRGDFGHISFTAKTNLISHYSKELGAEQAGTSNRMFIKPNAAIELLNRYYSD